MTEGCALLGCHSRSGRARSSTPVHSQPGSCSLWSLVCIEYETESEAIYSLYISKVSFDRDNELSGRCLVGGSSRVFQC